MLLCLLKLLAGQMFVNMADVGGSLAGIGRKIDAIAVGNAHIGVTEQANSRAAPSPVALKVNECFYPFLPWVTVSPSPR